MPELLGTTPQERAQVEMLWGILKDIKMATVIPMFNKDTVLAEHLSALLPKIEPVAAFLGEKTYLLGDRLTYVDFFLYEMIISWDWLTESKLYEDDEGKFKNLKPYMDRIYSLQGISKATDLVQNDPYNHPLIMKWGPINNYKGE